MVLWVKSPRVASSDEFRDKSHDNLLKIVDGSAKL